MKLLAILAFVAIVWLATLWLRLRAMRGLGDE